MTGKVWADQYMILLVKEGNKEHTFQCATNIFMFGPLHGREVSKNLGE